MEIKWIKPMAYEPDTRIIDDKNRIFYGIMAGGEKAFAEIPTLKAGRVTSAVYEIEPQTYNLADTDLSKAAMQLADLLSHRDSPIENERFLGYTNVNAGA